MGKRQALGWLGATVCSIALIVAGGLLLSSVAVNRYLRASDSELQRDQSATAETTAEPSELAGVERTVEAIRSMPGVKTAKSSVDRDDPTPTPSPDTRAPQDAKPSAGGSPLSYDVSVAMTADASTAQSADVVFAMTQQLQNARVCLELSSPAGAGHAASVIDYRNAFDTPVARSTVDSVSRAVAVAAAVPGVKSVHVTVPYTWNLASGDFDVELATDDSQQRAALKSALARTALAGVQWSTSQ